LRIGPNKQHRVGPLSISNTVGLVVTAYIFYRKQAYFKTQGFWWWHNVMAIWTAV